MVKQCFTSSRAHTNQLRGLSLKRLYFEVFSLALVFFLLGTVVLVGLSEAKFFATPVPKVTSRT